MEESQSYSVNTDGPVSLSLPPGYSVVLVPNDGVKRVAITRTEFLVKFGQLYAHPDYAMRTIDANLGFKLADMIFGEG